MSNCSGLMVFISYFGTVGVCMPLQGCREGDLIVQGRGEDGTFWIVAGVMPSATILVTHSRTWGREDLRQVHRPEPGEQALVDLIRVPLTGHRLHYVGKPILGLSVGPLRLPTRRGRWVPVTDAATPADLPPWFLVEVIGVGDRKGAMEIHETHQLVVPSGVLRVASH